MMLFIDMLTTLISGYVSQYALVIAMLVLMSPVMPKILMYGVILLANLSCKYNVLLKLIKEYNFSIS